MTYCEYFMTMQELYSHIETLPYDDRFRETVDNILRDKESHWVLNYYNNTQSIWKVKLVRLASALQEKREIFDRNKDILQKSQTQLKGPKPLPAKQRETLQFAINAAITQNTDLAVEIKRLLEEYNDTAFLEMMDRFTLCRIKEFRDKFQNDGDLNFLKKAITWTHLEYYKQCDKPLPELQQSLSSSAW